MLLAATLLLVAQTPLGERVGGEGEVTSLGLGSLKYVPGLLLASEPDWVNEADPPKPVEDTRPPKKGDLEGKLAMGTLATFGIAMAVTTGIGSWVDQNGDFGRVSAIAASTFGVGSLGFALGTILGAAAFFNDPKLRNLNLLEAILSAMVGAAFAFAIGVIVGTAGLVGGAVLGAVVSAPPGVQRGTLGVASASVLGAVSISMLGFAIAI